MKRVLLLATLFMAIALPCFAKDFQINFKEKIDYVNIDYFKQFGDENLTNYILKAIENNHNARIASYQVEEYRQAVKVSFGSELPTLSGGVNYLGLKTPDFMNVNIDNNILLVPFVAQYEADIFLKNRDKTRASKKNHEASKFNEKATYIALAGDVSSLYINILKTDKLLKLQKETLAAQTEIFKRTKDQFARGTVDYIALNNAQKSLEQSQSDVQELIKTREKMLNQFAVLIGQSPASPDELIFGQFDKLKNPSTPSEISSDVIFSRPDVLATEKKLEKAKIDVRVARKEFLPRFNIIGVLSFNSLGAGNFFSWESIFAGLLAGATQDIFAGGKKIANLKIQKSRYQQIFEEYKQVDLVAVQEVNDALCILKYDTKINDNALLQLKLANENYQRFDSKYQNGTVSYPNLLNQKISLIGVQQAQTNLKTNQIIDNITLYKAVGGQL